VRRVTPHRAWVALLALGAAACSEVVDGTTDAPPELRASVAARTVYPVKREEWRTDITQYVDSTMVPRSFRASEVTVALLQESPGRITQFEQHSKGGLLSTRPVRIDPVLNADVPRDIVAPTTLSRVTEDVTVDIMDSASSTLVRESIGGFVFRRELPLLRGGSGEICTVAPAMLLHVRHLGERRVLEAFSITGDPRDDALLGRHVLPNEPGARLRFGSGDRRHCLLLTARGVLVVQAPTDTGVAKGTVASPRVTTLRLPGEPAARTFDSAGARLASASARDIPVPQQPYVVDAAKVIGGYVVLVGLESDRRGRLIDYYDERGEYLQSAMLPFTASALTGAGPRFLLLHRDAKYRWWMSSWLTPMYARGAEAAPEPPAVTTAPEKQLFELPSQGPRGN
jgi:hypothetical protein